MTQRNPGETWSQKRGTDGAMDSTTKRSRRTVIAQGTPAERVIDIEPTGRTDVLGNRIYREVTSEDGGQ